jgi:hypothetical protein
MGMAISRAATIHPSGKYYPPHVARTSILDLVALIRNIHISGMVKQSQLQRISYGYRYTNEYRFEWLKICGAEVDFGSLIASPNEYR